MLYPQQSPSWLRYVHGWCRARGCDFEALMQVGEPLNDVPTFVRVFTHDGAGQFFWHPQTGWLALTFHECPATGCISPALHFWTVPGVGAWDVLRIGRRVLPQLLDMHGGFVNAHLPTGGVHALAQRLGAQDLGGGHYRWGRP